MDRREIEEGRATIAVIRQIRDASEAILEEDIPEPARSELVAKIAEHRVKYDGLIAEIEKAITRG